jgi:hypothetical protein
MQNQFKINLESPNFTSKQFKTSHNTSNIHHQSSIIQSGALSHPSMSGQHIKSDLSIVGLSVLGHLSSYHLIWGIVASLNVLSTYQIRPQLCRSFSARSPIILSFDLGHCHIPQCPISISNPTSALSVFQC